MASVSAAQHGAKVLLIDKGDKLGRKLAISGGGRCNVTNRMERKTLIEHIPGNGKFMHSPFSVFDNEDIISFFESLGIALKEEDHGRMFPITDKAKTVVEALLNKVRTLGVEIRTNTTVKDISFENGSVKEVLLNNDKSIPTKKIIIATGGKSVPHTGSTGDAYPWAKKAGHTITELYPTEVPITSNEPFIKEKLLQGLSLRAIKLSVINPKGKTIISHEGDLLFTHFGISGPSALRCSQFVVKALKKFKTNQVEMSIDLFPHQHKEELFQDILHIVKENPKKSFRNGIKAYLPDRILDYIFTRLSFDPSIAANQVPHEQIRNLIACFKDFTFTVNGTLSIEKAFVTGGGVSVKEVEPKSMHSRKQNGLYFCGEVLDIHGYTGGYNITCAFSTGYSAGKAAAESLNNH
ncbi:putative NAD-utilizing dehydrogenase [Bacillus sp. TS-2]|nr:putative NAD-utilizing dehydrogenase [Bacillus sp. TS-2]